MDAMRWESIVWFQEISYIFLHIINKSKNGLYIITTKPLDMIKPCIFFHQSSLSNSLSSWESMIDPRIVPHRCCHESRKTNQKQKRKRRREERSKKPRKYILFISSVAFPHQTIYFSRKGKERRPLGNQDEYRLVKRAQTMDAFMLNVWSKYGCCFINEECTYAWIITMDWGWAAKQA